MEELINYLYDMHVSADIKIEELAEDIMNIVESKHNLVEYIIENI